ncbi:MAG: prolipoprotein diacylglyceryl transferase, partial [Oscillatoriales cyanobacterium]
VSLTGIVLGLGGLAWLYYFDRALPDVVSPKCDRSQLPDRSPEEQ